MTALRYLKGGHLNLTYGSLVPTGMGQTSHIVRPRRDLVQALFQPFVSLHYTMGTCQYKSVSPAYGVANSISPVKSTDTDSKTLEVVTTNFKFSFIMYYIFLWLQAEAVSALEGLEASPVLSLMARSCPDMRVMLTI